MVLEAALLTVNAGCTEEFERAFRQASPLIASTPGYLGHELHRCVENAARYLLLVRWERLEDHTIGFRQALHYQDWKRLLHHFYSPFPVVEHFEQLDLLQP